MKYPVVVVGCGPTGMMLAAELTLAGVDVVVIERRRDQELESPRSRGLHARTIEVLDQRGIADRFLAEGTPMQVQAFAGIPLDISDFPTRHNYGLALLQSEFERILEVWISELGVRVLRGREVVEFAEVDDHMEIRCDEGTSLRADFLVGCDGSRSVVRKSAGIEFSGWDPTVCWITAEVEVAERPAFGLRGGGGIGPAELGRIGVTLAESTTDASQVEPTIEDVRAALRRVDGTDYGAHSPRYIARFTDVTRQAVSYRSGRVLLAGDAAHVHAPFGGQGLNLGVQDAVNLGWKLAQVVKGHSPVELLDTYQSERHPVAGKVMRNTMAQRALTATDDRSRALHSIVSELLELDEPRRLLAGMISGLDIDYGPNQGHPMIGRRVPDLELDTTDGPVTLYELLHSAEPLFINLDPGRAYGQLSGLRRLRQVDAVYRGGWALPLLGSVDAPTALLVRPDGYVAWAGTGTDDGLELAATTWFGWGAEHGNVVR